MRNHKSNYKNNLSCSSKEIICYDDFEVEVLAEIYYVENKYDINLLNLEREYMEQYKCVNKVRPITTEKERKEYEKSDKRKENKKEYQKSDKYKEYQKEYKKSDKRKEYMKDYKKSDKYKEYQKEHYLKNKSK